VKSALTFIVRRGALRRFHRLKQAAADLSVDVIWDRRTGERRGSNDNGEQRRSERRRQPSFTWTAADFLVVEKEDEE
jgi:hypothetical protein